MTYQGALDLHDGRDLGISDIASGMLGSIVFAMLVGAVVLLGIVIAAWQTRDLRTGLAIAVLSLVPLGAFNLHVARFIQTHPLLLNGVPEKTSTYLGQAMSTMGEVFYPAVPGLVIAFFVVRRVHERIFAEQNRVVYASRAEREAEAERMGTSGSVKFAPAASEPAPVAPAAPPAAVPPTERRAITCRSCGASNAPINSRCLRCGAALQT